MHGANGSSARKVARRTQGRSLKYTESALLKAGAIDGTRGQEGGGGVGRQDVNTLLDK